jgi:hypothetical protein
MTHSFTSPITLTFPVAQLHDVTKTGENVGSTRDSALAHFMRPVRPLEPSKQSGLAVISFLENS